jgi:hypothetical protein
LAFVGRQTALANKLTLNFEFPALQSIKILFSCEDFSEKSFASLINRTRARRRARAREAINPI